MLCSSSREYNLFERVYMVNNNAEVGQSKIHVAGRAQGFPTERCSQHHTASTGLPSQINSHGHVKNSLDLVTFFHCSVVHL